MLFKYYLILHFILVLALEACDAISVRNNCGSGGDIICKKSIKCKEVKSEVELPSF